MRTMGTLALVLLTAVSAPVFAQSCCQPGCTAASGGDNLGLDYVTVMHRMHADISALAEIGARMACDPSIRDFSRKIMNEQSDQDGMLVQWYSARGCAPLAPATPVRTAGLIQRLSCLSDGEFDKAYVAAMADMLTRQRALAETWLGKLCPPSLANQASLVIRTAGNESNAFMRWMSTGFLTIDQQARYCAANPCDTGRCP